MSADELDDDFTEDGERAPCPSCGRMILVNLDGRLRHHFPIGGGWARGGACPGSRRSVAMGAVAVRKLKDGVVIKVRHAPGVVDDEAVTDELVLIDAEWAELVRVTTMAERARLRPLVASWRVSADALAARNPAWATHFLDCAMELERMLGADGGAS